MAKARVHELAKEFGVPSKQVLEALKEMGEFVKSASSTVEAPVVRRLSEERGEAWIQAASAKAAKTAAKKAPATKPDDQPTGGVSSTPVTVGADDIAEVPIEVA